MVKLYAVSYMDFSNNDMTIEFHRGDCWQDALMQHTQTSWCAESEAAIRAQSMEDAQEDAFNGDWLFDVKEVPSV